MIQTSQCLVPCLTPRGRSVTLATVIEILGRKSVQHIKTGVQQLFVALTDFHWEINLANINLNQNIFPLNITE